MKSEFEILTQFSAPEAPAAILGESPAVDAAAAQAWWVDTAGKRLFRTDLSTQATAFWDLPEEPGFVVLDAARLPVLGMETGLFRFVPDADLLQKLMGLDKPGHRFNDATVDANGALWVSTMARDLAKGEAAIYRVSPICVCSRWSRALPSPTAWRSMWNEAGFIIPTRIGTCRRSGASASISTPARRANRWSSPR